MVNEKFMMVSLEDPKMKSLSDVLGNKTCKKIIDYLAENTEASQKDLADALSIPINTVEYNIKKLLKSSLVQKRSNFFWSKKGKKIVMYELSNKSIIISPRKSMGEKLLKVLPSVMIVGALSFGTFVYEKIRQTASLTDVRNQMSDSLVREGPGLLKGGAMDMAEPTVYAMAESAPMANDIANVAMNTPSELWMWFLAGGLIALFVYSLVNWRKL